MNKLDEETANWLCKRFKLKRDDIAWFHSGICYDRICVATKEAADKVTEAVKGQSVNGGCYDGMTLGYQSKTENGFYEVMC